MPPAALTASKAACVAFGTSLKSAGPVTVDTAPTLIAPSLQVGPAAKAVPATVERPMPASAAVSSLDFQCMFVSPIFVMRFWSGGGAHRRGDAGGVDGGKLHQRVRCGLA